MLTAVRAMASRVAHDLAHMDTQRLGARRDAEEQDELLAEVLENALEAGKEAVERGPEQLAVLREAGRGGRGRLRPDRDHGRLPRGAARRQAPPLEHHVRAGGAAPPRARVVELPLLHELRGDRRGARGGPLRPAAGGASATRCWWWATTARCACTSTPTSPDAAVALFDGRGRGVALRRRRHARAGRRSQRAARRRRRLGGRLARDLRRRWRWRAATGSCACTRSSACRWWTAAPTMNPSTYELLAGIHAAPAREVLVLPNSPNVILAAERAARAVRASPRAWCPPPRRRRAWPRCWPSTRARREDERRRRGERRGGAAHRRRGPGRARRRPGPLHGRRRRGLRRRRAGGLGRPCGEALPRDARAARRGRASCSPASPARRAARARRASRARCRTGVELEYHEGGQPAWWWLLCRRVAAAHAHALRATPPS